ncbi:hypothetical protein OQH60_08360 [Campylobacter sp. MIT 21-1685]|uniref:hypothetical protein n=1 Tax=unclassified Campylobacter TaxID=2593542 RepID=UPI00224B3C42|nr:MULTISPECIES: hypothetical protein [unclassified Campylobacter]MCX2683864.1 hypothetical protein [Campylobacter sp. MIT 21-1684]MCX2752152.1 hypothetical protein [Campylobacter sp. MIT 21-1682]MCX2808345.1 hypothetical protein [Campylobacter sp. MIT 21-1685]
MHYIFTILFCYNSLFALIEKEKSFEDTNITEAYRQIKNSFSEGYYLPQNIKAMENITQMLDDKESEIYGYKNFKVLWHNENEVTISLNAFENGERICTYKSYDIFLKQINTNVQGIIESKMLYPQDIQTYIQNACACNYFRGEYGYDKARQKELDEKIEQYCKPLPQTYNILQEKYNNQPKMQKILKRVNEL